MKSNNFVFADLSCYNPQLAINFYENVFGWKYFDYQGYHTAFLGNREVVGLYETPEKFKQMRMPHFWMSYIKVNDIDETVSKARQMEGIIELVDKNNSIGPVALIRDPQGAGFSIYDGKKLDSRTSNIPNTLIWNELHVSNTQKIIPFYQELFDWKIKEEETNHLKIFESEDQHIADIFNIPNAYKGKYEYWVCSFGVENLEVTKKRIITHGGSIIAVEDHRILCTDNSGEAFFYIQEIKNK